MDPLLTSTDIIDWEYPVVLSLGADLPVSLYGQHQTHRRQLMRMMLKVVVPVEAGNKAVKDGSLPRIMQETVERLKPEAAYFLAEDGKRTAIFFFDMQDVSQTPVIAEPLFMGMNAALTLVPVMNADDLKKGLAQAAKNF